MVTLSALISNLEHELVRLGYKESTMTWYRGCWRRLERYFADQQVEAFSSEMAMAWVDTGEHKNRGAIVTDATQEEPVRNSELRFNDSCFTVGRDYLVASISVPLH